MPPISNMHREFLGAWNRRDFEQMKTLLHPDYVYVAGDGKEARGIEAGLQNAYIYARAFPDSRCIGLRFLSVAGISPQY